MKKKEFVATGAGRRRRGRPVSRHVDQALIQAAVKEFIARGYHAMSMESIAERAGVSKLSLYRRWPNKLAVAVEVFRVLRDERPIEDHGSLEADIRAMVQHTTGSVRGATADARLILRTMGEISESPALLAAYREHLLTPRLAELRAVLERARARGELRPGVPIDVAGALITGPVFLYYLTLLSGTEFDLTDSLANQFTRLVLEGIGAPVARKRED